MSVRFQRILFVGAIIVLLLVAAAYLHNIGGVHPHINTAGEIAFVSDRQSPGYTHIWIMNADGSNPRELTRGNENDTDPAFSPDGSEIAFASDRSGQPEIYVMEADGANPHAVTIGSDSKSDPQFSPDGSLLAYLTRGTLMTIDLNSNETTPQLPLGVGATSSSVAQLTHIAQAPVTRYWWQPSSSSKPQNGAIAAVQEDEAAGLQAVAILPKLGGDPQMVAEGDNVSCGWSPDGTTLAIAALGFKGPGGKMFSGLLLCGPDGKVAPPPLPLSENIAVGPQNPAFNPDGTQIAFEIWNQPDIAKRTIEGLAVTQVSGGNGIAMLVRGDATRIRWSPDGAHALYLMPSAADKDKEDIWEMNPDGSNQVNLTQGQGDNTEPVWSPSVPKPQS